MYMDYHKKLSEIDEEKIQEDYEDWKNQKKLEILNSNETIETKIKSLNHHKSDLTNFNMMRIVNFVLKMVKNKYTK